MKAHINLRQEPLTKKVGFSTMGFTAKILSWRFRHLNLVGCLLKRRPTKGGSRAPRTPPLATPLNWMTSCALLKTEPAGDDLQRTALQSTDDGDDDDDDDDEWLDTGIQRQSITNPYKESLYLFFLDNL